jgi:hypothetical protein
VENVCLLIGVDVNENGTERGVYSLLQIDWRRAGVNDDDDPGERYYSEENIFYENDSINIYFPFTWIKIINYRFCFYI